MENIDRREIENKIGDLRVQIHVLTDMIAEFENSRNDALEEGDTEGVVTFTGRIEWLQKQIKEYEGFIKRFEQLKDKFMYYDDALEILRPYFTGHRVNTFLNFCSICDESRFTLQRLQKALRSCGVQCSDPSPMSNGDYAIVFNPPPDTLRKTLETPPPKPTHKRRSKQENEPKVKTREPRFLGRRPTI